MLSCYGFGSADMLRCLGHRLAQVQRDAASTLDHVMRHVTTPETQEAALEALRLGCGMLRTQLDAIKNVYVTGGSCPPAWADGEALVEGEA